MCEKKYEERIVSFVDILGFSQEICSAGNGELEAVRSKVKKFRSAFAEASFRKSEPFKPGVETDNGVIFLQFSDCFIRAKSMTVSPLHYELLSYVHGIADIVNQGFLVRGAVTHGDFYYDDNENVLISPAFIQAYRLESTEASSPRVIVDPKTLQALSHRSDWWRWSNRSDLLSEELEEHHKLLRRDSDGYYFVDYLRCIYPEMDEPNDDYPEYLQRHKEFIERSLKEQKDVRTLKKFIWLGNYHNAVVSEFESWTKFKIDQNLLIL